MLQFTSTVKNVHVMRRKTTKPDTGKLIGYARVSTDEQSVAMQIEALMSHGVVEKDIYSENMSGSVRNRPALTKAMRAVTEGDTFVVWKFDRVARSLKNLLEIVEELKGRGVAFKSLTEDVNTGSPTGSFFVSMLGAFAQFERDMIRERTQAGVDRARAKGVKFGADFKLQEKDMKRVWKMRHEKGMTYEAIGKVFGVSGPTITRRLNQFESK